MKIDNEPFIDNNFKYYEITPLKPVMLDSIKISISDSGKISVSLISENEFLSKYPHSQDLLIKCLNILKNEYISSVIKNKSDGKNIGFILIPSSFNKICNLACYKLNYEFLARAGLQLEKINYIFLNNPILLSKTVYEIEELYKHLLNESILPEEQIEMLLFNCSIENRNQEDIFIILLDEYLKNEQNPDFQFLLHDQTPDFVSELVDRLEYIKVMRILEKTSTDKTAYDKARKILKSSLFETISAKDDEEITKINPKYGNRPDLFPGIKMALYKELEGIHEGFFDDFWNIASPNIRNPIYELFFSTLKFGNYTNNTDNRKKIKEATYCKNEIVGKITYTYLLFKKMIGERRTPSIQLSEILADETSFKNIEGIPSDDVKELLKINPYSFDMFRHPDKITAAEVKYSHLAMQSGYLFSEEELVRYDDISTRITNYIHNPSANPLSPELQSKYFIDLSLGRNIRDYYDRGLPLIQNYDRNYKNFKYTINHILQYINNRIEIPKIDPQDKTEYVKQVRELIKQFIHDRNDETVSKEQMSNGLFEVLRAVDLYLRSNNEYINQQFQKGEEITVAHNTIFSKTSNVPEIDRILYSIYNCNRLAHDTININLNLEFIPDRFHRREDEQRSIAKYIDAYKTLNRYGFSFEFIKHLIENAPPLKDRLTKEVGEEEKSTYISKTREILLESIRFPYPPSDNDILDINKYFKIISECPDLHKIEQYAEEQALFYETKTVLAEELMIELLDKLNIDIDNIATLNSSEKRKFYKQNGYIIEAQKDDNNQPILVFYSKLFKEPFSIHLKSLNVNLGDGINSYLSSPEYKSTIANYKIEPPGLTLRTTPYKISKKGARIKQIPNPQFITKEGSNIDVEYSVALQNYINYDIYDDIIEQIEKGIFTIETLKELLKDFSGIDDVNLKYEGENKPLLTSLYRNILLQVKEEIRIREENQSNLLGSK